jgi:hypothetical protein
MRQAAGLPEYKHLVSEAITFAKSVGSNKGLSQQEITDLVLSHDRMILMCRLLFTL